MRLIVATNNAGKLAELRDLLPGHIELVTLRDAGLASPDESGETFFDNALLKAVAAAQAADGAIADDSGLEVTALDSAPGVHSARFTGPAASDDDNNRGLLDALAQVAAGERGARFVSCVVLMLADGRMWSAEGTVTGRIVDSPRGSNGFGYDPLFEICDPLAGTLNGRTMAELAPGEKNQISHRARAFQALVAQLEDADVWPTEGRRA